MRTGLSMRLVTRDKSILAYAGVAGFDPVAA
jgi:hypothetical protein